MANTHTAIATTALRTIDAVQVTTESPATGEVLIKAEYGSMIAFDSYQTDRGIYVDKYPHVLGFSVAGRIHSVGHGVNDLAIGDRVTAFGFGQSKHKSLQQYVIQPRAVCAKIPDSLPLADASTIPDNFVTAFYTLFNQLSLPVPSSFPAPSPPPLARAPILIYGAGTTSGQYALQLLHLAGYTNVIATASPTHHALLKSTGAAHVFDYRDPGLVEKIEEAVGEDGKVLLAIDCVSAETTIRALSKLMSPLGTLAVLLPVKEGDKVTGGPGEGMLWEVDTEKYGFAKSVKIVLVRTFLYLNDEKLKEELMPRILPELLSKGQIKPTKVRLLDQGSFVERVAAGLDLFRRNEVSGEKVVVKI